MTRTWLITGSARGLGLGAYQAARWAVGGFSQVLALEVAHLGIKVTVVEPGFMRTDWAGSSMAVAPAGEPYKPVIEPFAAMLRGASGTVGADPARVSEILLDLADADNPPMRLLIGSDAVAVAREAVTGLAAADAVWREVSESADPVPAGGTSQG